MRVTGRFAVVVGLVLLGSYLFLSTSHSQSQTPTSSALLIEGGTLIDGTGKAPVSDTAILVEGGRIRQIGKKGELKAPNGGQTIQAGGKFILPGLIDSHVHYNSNWLHKLYLAKGVTTVRDMVGPIERTVTLRDEIAAGNILAPRLYVSVNPGSWKSQGYSSARDMTEKTIKRYAPDGIKVTGYNEVELKEIVQVAHANHLIVYGHTGPRMNGKGLPNVGWGTGMGTLRAVEAGLDGVEHVSDFVEDCVDKDIPLPADYDPMRRDHAFRHYYANIAGAVNPSRVDHLIEVMVKRGTYLSPTLTVYDIVLARRNTPAIAANPALKYMPEDKPDRWGVYGEKERAGWQKTMRVMREVTYKFQKAGGLLILGTDSQAAAPDGADPGWSYHEELENFVNAGIAPMDALRAATLNNAKVLNKEKDLGTVEVGKFADILILDANPLQDIRNTQKIHRVILNGMVLDPEVLLEQHLKQFGERGKRGRTSLAPPTPGFTSKILE